MNKTYIKNLDLLESISPGLKDKLLKKIHPNKNLRFINYPYPNIQIGKRTIHSKINPVAESEKLLRNININKIGETIFLFLGMGIGYHIKTFIERYGNMIDKSKIIIIEKNPNLFKLVIENLDISFLKKATIFIDEKLDKLKSYFSRIDPLTFGGYRIIKLKGSIIESTEYYQTIEKLFKNIITSKLSDILTRFSFEILWIRNIIENIPNLLYSSPINLLKNIATDKSTIVIGAGPSLINQIEIIKELSKKMFIISVDTALPSLLKYEIKPDIVVTLDGQFQSLMDFLYLFTDNKFLPKPILVYDLLAYPKIVRMFQFNSYFTGSLNIYKHQNGNISYIDNPFVNYIKHTTLNFDSLQCGGSVLTTALELALYMNFSKIILVGADFSYTQFKTHINSSPAYHAFFTSSDRLSTISTKNIQNIIKRNVSTFPGIKSKIIFTDYILMTYKNWIENQDRYKEKLLNATEDGLNIYNLEHIELKELRNNIPDMEKPKIDGILKTIKKEILYNFLTKLDEDLNFLLKTIENKEFSIEKTWQMFPYFHNILIESKKILKDGKKIEVYFYKISNLLKKTIKKSLNRLDKKYGL